MAYAMPPFSEHITSPAGTSTVEFSLRRCLACANVLIVMPVHRDDDAERQTRTQELLKRLRHQADVSKEERRIVSESMAEHSADAKRESARARRSAVRRGANTRKRTSRKKS